MLHVLVLIDIWAAEKTTLGGINIRFIFQSLVFYSSKDLLIFEIKMLISRIWCTSSSICEHLCHWHGLKNKWKKSRWNVAAFFEHSLLTYYLYLLLIQLSEKKYSVWKIYSKNTFLQRFQDNYLLKFILYGTVLNESELYLRHYSV